MKAKRIVCVGDSLTYGHESSNPLTKSYPARLVVLLGGEYEVVNAGYNGATMLGSHGGANDRAYRETEAWQRSMAQPADIVIVMLGANDANPTVGLAARSGGLLSAGQLALYREDAQELLAGYQGLSGCIWLCRTMPMYREAGALYDGHYIRCFQENLRRLRELQTLIARTTGCELIDTFTPMQRREWYADGLHLNDQGYLALARLFAERINERERRK